MASDSLPEQRTELPTERRMGELRKEGALFHSTELEGAIVLFTGFMVLSATWQALFEDLLYVLRRSFTMIGERQSFEMNDLTNGFLRILMLLVPNVLILVVSVGLVAAFTVMLQTNWNRRPQWIKFRWDFLNPLNGLKRIISINGAVNFGKALLKLCFILPIGYFALKALAPDMVRLVHMSMRDVLNLTGSALTSVFWKILYVFIGLAIFDWVWGKFQWLKQNKMTKDEVKDERKAVEGDETTKRKMIAKGMQRLASRLKKSVPAADVVVTNPTHYAIALKYDRNRNAAPIVVAKGADFIAQKIKEIARENGIPVLERKPLARALYASTEVGAEIPRDLFRAVAEVLAYVYKLKHGGRSASTQSGR
jgi:flagellar biosynthetic protein FlhB